VTVQIAQGTQFVFGIGFGIAHGLLYPALNAMALEHVTERGRGVVATVLNGTFSLGYAAAVFGLGVVADGFGYRTVFFGTALLVVTGALAIFSAKPSGQRG
jgi:MFS family permease